VSDNPDRTTQESREDLAPSPPPVEASISRRPETTGQPTLALVVALAAIAIVDTYLPDAIRQNLFSPPVDYAQVRRDVGFAGIPVELVAEAIDRRLPANEPVSLAPSIKSNPLIEQRFCEGLYPRRLAGNAVHQVTIAPAAAGVALAGSVKLLGPPTTAKLAPREYQSLSRSPGRALLCVVSILGLGLGVLAGLRRLGAGRHIKILTPGWLFPTAILVGLMSVALLSCLATWIHLPLPWNVLAGIGLASALGVSVQWIVPLIRQGALKSRARDLARAALSVLRRPEVLLGLTALAFAFYVVDHQPIHMWDARSIWFFRAKQLFFAGRFLPEDAKDYPWAHPGYPLLYPSALAFFSSFGSWDERRAAVAIAVLLAAMSSLIFMLARRTLGRWPGAVVAFIPGLYLFTLLLGGYADGHVTLCLLLAVFGLCSEDTEGIGWLGAFAASLVKREGFVLAVILCAIHTVIGNSSRRRPWPRRAMPFLGFVPPVIYAFWVKHLGVVDAYAGAKLPTQAHEIWTRLSTIWDAMRAHLWLRMPAKIGFVGFLVALVFARNWRRVPGGAAASLTGLAALGFTSVVFLVTPFDLNWHLSRALERLVSHAWLLLAMGGVLLAAGRLREH
jgi:hypothetical protein